MKRGTLSHTKLFILMNIQILWNEQWSTIIRKETKNRMLYRFYDGYIRLREKKSMSKLIE